MSAYQMSVAAGIILAVVFAVSDSFLIPMVAFFAGGMLGISIMMDLGKSSEE